LPLREREIAARLREARMRDGLSRVDLAKRIGVDSSKLTNYELGRAATPYHVAAKVAAVTDTTLRWLAIGEFPIHGFNEMPQEFEMLIPLTALLSNVFDRIIAPNWHQLELKSDAPLKNISGSSAYWVHIGGANLVPMRFRLLEYGIEQGKQLPGPFRAQFIETLINAVGQFFVENEQQIERFKKRPPHAFLNQQKLFSEYIRDALADKSNPTVKHRSKKNSKSNPA
jgi:transcriptional regulator with XRE-family HTH domain